MPALTLEVVGGPDAGRSVALVGEMEIGRHPAAGLRLGDDLVSRRHARVRVQVDGAVIEDLSSSNGTFVNDREIREPTRIAEGDTLLIGASVIRLRRTVEPSVPAPARPAPDPPAAAVLLEEQTEEQVSTAAYPRIGSELAGYRIEAIVGRGGMGIVYRAEHLKLGRKVALKLLPPDLAATPGFRERFEGESRLAAAIDHPHIIPLYDAGMTDGLLYLTMRFVDGLDLKGLLARDGPLALDRAVTIVAQVGGALDAAHARGLVHRDVKPANVLVASGAGPEASDHCYLTDFGLTKDTTSPLQLTRPGQFVGTIGYVAPEQIQGATPSGAADQYALGCVLYECLTGHSPFERGADLDVMRAHLDAAPPAVTDRRLDVPAAIDAVLARAMAKAPAARYESCTAMATAAREAGTRRDP